MPVATDRVLQLARTLKGFEPHPGLSLEGYLAEIPRLESLASIPSGTPVLVRGDVDAKPGPALGERTGQRSPGDPAADDECVDGVHPENPNTCSNRVV